MKLSTLALFLSLAGPLAAQCGPNAKWTAVPGGHSCVPTAAAPSATVKQYYMSTTGSDSNPCTSSSKCATLAHTLSLLPAVLTQPYTINVADGTYAEPINFLGYQGSLGGQVTILGDTATPANVVFNGTTTCIPSDGSTGYTVTVCELSTAVLKLNGLTVTAATGTGRAVFAMDGAHLIVANFVATCPTMTSGSLCVEVAINSSLEIISPTTINLTGATATGTGLMIHQGAYTAFYGDPANGAFTIAGPNANTDTLTGISIIRRGVFDVHLLTANQTSTISITGVSTGIFIGEGLWMQSSTGTGNPAVTISHSSGTTGIGIYAEGRWYANVGGMQMTNLATGWQADTGANIAQKNCSYTNVTTHTNISAGSGLACF